MNFFRQRSIEFLSGSVRNIWKRDARKRGGISGEQCSVVFALIVSEKDSEGGRLFYPSSLHTDTHFHIGLGISDKKIIPRKAE
jgi:hypothetical protein